MLNFFKSPVRRAIEKYLENRIKTHESAYKAEVANVEKNAEAEVAKIKNEYLATLTQVDINAENRKHEILEKRVKDIFANITL